MQFTNGPHLWSLVLSTAAAGLAAVFIGACGDDADDGTPALATVGNTVIPKAEFTRRLAAVREINAQVGAGQTEPPHIPRRQLIDQMIEGEWIRQEAAAMGIDAPAAEVERLAEPFTQQRDNRMSRLYFRATGGMDGARVSLLRQKLVDARTKPVTEDDIKRFARSLPDQQQPFEEVGRSVKEELRIKHREAALVGLPKYLRERYRSRTRCGDGFNAPACGDRS